MTPAETTAITAKAEQWASSCGADFVGLLIDTFLADAPRRFVALRTAYRDRDVDGFRRAAHTLKSSAGQLGATGYVEIAKCVEVAARQGRMTDMLEVVDLLEREFAALRRALLELRRSYAER